MRKDVIPVEDAQGGPRSPRRFLRLLALLLAAFALLSAVWYFTAYRPYDVYMEALRAQPGWREAGLCFRSYSTRSTWSISPSGYWCLMES